MPKTTKTRSAQLDREIDEVLAKAIKLHAHDLNVLAQAASFGDISLEDLAPSPRTVARISPTSHKRTRAALCRLEGLVAAGLLEPKGGSRGVGASRYTITNAGRAALTAAGYVQESTGYWLVPGADRPRWT
jgi:hypothetical protein